MRHDDNNEGQSRRQALECMVWAGAGVLWTVAGGRPALAADQPGGSRRHRRRRALSFVQISDSHIGFKNAPNTDTPGTLADAIQLVNQHKGAAAFMIHTGDVSHLSRARPVRHRRADQSRRRAGHPLRARRARRARGRRQDLLRALHQGRGQGWYSWDQEGVHFVGLNNVQNLRGRRPRQSRRRAARLARAATCRALRQPPGRGLRPRAALDGQPGMGLGHR